MPGRARRDHQYQSRSADAGAGCAEPHQFPPLRREIDLVRLIATQKVHLGEAPVARVGDDRGKQYRGGISPAEIGPAGALIEADASCHLEGDHDCDDGFADGQLVDRDLVEPGAEAAARREAVEAGQEAGAVAPLGTVELPQGAEGPDS